MLAKDLAAALLKNPDQEVFLQWQAKGEQTRHTSDIMVVGFDKDEQPHDLTKETIQGITPVIVGRGCFDDASIPPLTLEEVSD